MPVRNFWSGNQSYIYWYIFRRVWVPFCSYLCSAWL